jgi:uncharacterized membrane protein HdeD (DUF308 family)
MNLAPASQADPGGERGALRIRLAGVAVLALGLAALLLPLIADRLPAAALVGWLLLTAGLAELLAGSARAPAEPRRRAMLVGAVTSLAGLLFLVDIYVPFMTAGYIVMTWLLVRGVLLFRLAACSAGAARNVVRFGGLADLILGAILLVGLPVSTLVLALFGPTPELVASFALVFAASFLVTGLMLLFLAAAERRADQRL